MPPKSNSRLPFLLGMGGQKCGTTWMYSHLKNHPGSLMPLNLHKEYAFWNEWEAGERNGLRNRIKGMLLPSFISYKRIRRPGQMIKGSTLRTWIASPEEYRDHFVKQTKGYDAGEPRAFVGEITPENGLLSKETYKLLWETLSPSFDLKPFVIYRRPDLRLESQIKHYIRNGLFLRKNLDSTRIEKPAEAFSFVDTFTNAWGLTDYAEQWSQMKAGLPPGSVHFMLYEELFGPDGKEILNDFHHWAGIAPSDGKNLASPSFAAPKSSSGLTEDQRAFVRTKYSSSWKAAEEIFGAERVKKAWGKP